MKTKHIKYPIHKMGKTCGYNEFQDGSIEIAGTYWMPMNEAFEQTEALDALLASVTAQCHKLLVPIERNKRRFWDSVEEDYKLDFEKFHYFYNNKTHIITKTTKT